MDHYEIMKQHWLHWLVGFFVKNRRQTWLRWHCFHDRFHRHLTPTITFKPWEKSCLATIPELGIVTHSIGIGFEFWSWAWMLSFGVSTQSPEDAAKMACNR
jgi:hypothetical protein